MKPSLWLHASHPRITAGFDGAYGKHLPRLLCCPELDRLPGSLEKVADEPGQDFGRNDFLVSESDASSLADGSNERGTPTLAEQTR